MRKKRDVSFRWFVRYKGKVVRSPGREKFTLDAPGADMALEKARRRFWLNPSLVEVFSPTAPPPDPSAADEGRAWWMGLGY